MFPMEPMSEMHVGDGVSIISMCKTVTENNDTNSMWFAQVILFDQDCDWHSAQVWFLLRAKTFLR